MEPPTATSRQIAAEGDGLAKKRLLVRQSDTTPNNRWRQLVVAWASGVIFELASGMGAGMGAQCAFAWLKELA